MGKSIQIQDLRDADILLYHGSSWLSRAIRFFDGTPYNHASINVGNDNVMEAIAEGVVRRSIKESIAHYEPVIVMRLIDRPNDVSPVLSKAQQYEGKRYAYEQLLLLALICSFRKVRLNNAVAKFVGKVLEGAASVLLKFTKGNKEALVCSELVYRSYDEAIEGYNDPYTIYLEREHKIVRPKSSIVLENINTSLISEYSIASYFYGVNRTYAFNKLSASLCLKQKDIEEIYKSIKVTTVPSDTDFEILFNQAVDSYETEDYNLDEGNEKELKRSLDIFAVASFYSRININKFTITGSYGDILQEFLKTNANFVTPGDLYKAKNLQHIGAIK